MQKITPFLWFNDNAEEAINFYTSIFKNSKVIHVSRYTTPDPAARIPLSQERLSLRVRNLWC